MPDLPILNLPGQIRAKFSLKMVDCCKDRFFLYAKPQSLISIKILCISIGDKCSSSDEFLTSYKLFYKLIG